MKENRPRTFNFGNFGNDVVACHDACAAEPECLAYSLHTMNFKQSKWRGWCFGRGPGAQEKLVSQNEVISGIRIHC